MFSGGVGSWAAARRVADKVGTAATKWLDAHCDPKDTTVYVGIDWTEEHRYTKLQKIRADQGWNYQAPMTEPPFVSKKAMLNLLKLRGIEPPRLYAMGFAHNNCGGFCIKAGHGHFANLLKTMPTRYRWHEQKEQELRAFLDKDVSIMSDRTGDGIKKPLTMKALRERIEGGQQPDMFDIGGCGCFVTEDDQ